MRTMILGAAGLLLPLLPVSAESQETRLLTPQFMTESAGDVPSLVRHEEVLQAKLERKRQKPTRVGPTAPKQRDVERWQDRLGRDGTIPPHVLLRAKEHMDAMPEPERGIGRDAGIWNWTWLGPGNIGGRVRAFVFHPGNANLMWLGSASGGIWKSTNGGSSWAPVDDFLSTLAVGALAIDAISPSVMYAGTGEFSGTASSLNAEGILKSTDGGATWTQLSSTASWNGAVGRIACSPSTSGLVLAVNGTRVLRSTNAGVSWSVVQTVSGSSFVDVKFGRGSWAGLAMAATKGSDSQLFLSTNGGSTWTEETGSPPTGIQSGGIGRIEVAHGPGGVLFASLDRSGGEVWRSTNQGASWFPRSVGRGYLCREQDPLDGCQGGYDNMIWVSPSDANVVVVGGIDIYRSTDAGLSFAKISNWTQFHLGTSAHADQHLMRAHPNFNGVTNKTVFVANDGGIQTTSDIMGAFPAGTGWTSLASQLGITQFVAGAVAADGSVAIGGAQDNGILRYRPGDGANAWLQCANCTGDGMAAAINPLNSLEIHASTQNLSLKRSIDQGNVYLPNTNGCSDCGDDAQTRFKAPFALAPSNPSTLVAGGRTIWRTTNSGANWSSVRAPLSGDLPCSAVAIAPQNSSRAWLGYTGGTVSRNTTSAGLWTDVTGVGMPGTTVTDIAIAPSNQSEVFVTVGGSDGESVWYTPDDGATWQLRQGTGANTLPNVQVNTIAIHPLNPQWVYVGTDIGVFSSEDKGITWSRTPRYPGNEGPVNVAVDDLMWQGTQYLIAATHGRGMFRCSPLPIVYVDLANGGPEDGTVADPWNTVGEAESNRGPGATISVEAGTYGESSLVLDKRGTFVAPSGLVRIQ